ncbi:MAG: hypothetical protein ACNA8S_10750 [Deferrisomatales bacterium]
MSDASFWESGVGRLIRWLAFLPIAFFLISLLQTIPVRTVFWAANYIPDLNLLTLILAIVAVSLIGTAGWFWVLGVSMTPVFACGVIAPNAKVGSVIFGTLYCLIQGLFLLGVLSSGAHWVFKGYQLVFGLIVLGGTIGAYKSA